MDDKKIGILTWQKLGTFLVAKDPIETDKRWLIKEHKNGWELLSVQFGVEKSHIMDTKLAYVFWYATCLRIQQSARNYFHHLELTTKEEVANIQNLFRKLSEVNI